MIYIALGANLPSRYGTPAQTLEAAKDELQRRAIKITHSSHIWLTAPVPFDPDIPYYHNAVIAVETELPAPDLLQLMLAIESDFGRVRTEKNAPRLIDLDLIAYHDEIIKQDDFLILPHPRMHERAFVLKPLKEIAAEWTHPVTDAHIDELITALPDDQEAKIIEQEAV